MIVFGTLKFGWVDKVEDLGTVATMFVHIMYIPLIPMGTYLMVGEDRGLKIPFSIKSVLVAYVRSALFWTALLSTLGAIVSSGFTCLCAAPLWIAYGVMPFLVRTASESRAEELRNLAMQ